MSALKHGFFRAGFMLCDRCALNTKCKHFKPEGQCLLERKAFERVVSDLMEEFWERFETMCLTKNMYLEGFTGYFGMYWTEQAFYEEYIRPGHKPIWEAFEKYVEKDEDARSVLNKLKEQFKYVEYIHASLIDLLENEYLDKARDLLVARILELIHTEEGLQQCDEDRCELQREKLRKNRDKNADV